MLSLPFLKSSEQRLHEASIASAQSVAYQAWEFEKRRQTESLSQNGATRAPSSVPDPSHETVEGILGLDSAGFPFHYKIRIEGESRVVDIWTEGPHSVKTQVIIPVADSR